MLLTFAGIIAEIKLKHFLAWPYMVVLTVLFSGCNGPVYEKYIGINDKNWSASDSFEFKVPIKQPGKYALYLNLRTTEDYPFANLWLNVNMHEPNGQGNKQRFNIPLYSPEGYPLQHNLGIAHIRKFPAARIEQRILPVDFTETGTYTFTLKHEMRQKEINGIEKIGLQLKRIK